ncbi:putative CUE domain protein [Talaromyces proteolyticus]|uniref:CUE domain protein n=1 Tax=Talaromyces proteolyticus TaxID=1131652 RepID=A0AAD4PZ85_9EURO|nr:putative CUE domain protein [Talaromyces proteolyticus]KAH8698756.1 putative CUE domain protein [Talaromyces proteolyticus]
MGAEAPRKRRRLFFESYAEIDAQKNGLKEQNQNLEVDQSAIHQVQQEEHHENESTDMKLARLLSLFPNSDEAALLDVLISYEGCVEAASAAIDAGQEDAEQTEDSPASPIEQASKSTPIPGIQTSLLSSFSIPPSSLGWSKPLTKRGKTLYLYSPEDVARNTPCSIIHNFLPPTQANALLEELLEDAKSYECEKFQLFDTEVQSHHTSKLYVSEAQGMMERSSEFVYNGSFRNNVRKLSPLMNTVSEKVQKAVNREIQARIKSHYPGGKKLKYQSPDEWLPNAAVVNCYTGPQENLGWHSDQLTYLGPRAVIGSLSLGVAREFRVRRVVPRDNDQENKQDVTKSHSSDRVSDTQGQISIHLPHNSLLVMHAEMQEEWKHSVPTALTISPHPIAGNRRINVTYRCWRKSFDPQNIPRCRCGLPTILRCVQRKHENYGRYMWMCYAGYSPGKKGCSFFQWARFDDDGEPLWEEMGIRPVAKGKMG